MKKLSLAVIAVLGLSVGAFAQDNNDDTHDVTIVIPEVALLDIEPTGSKNITQTFVAPTEAGLGLTAPTANTALWLNYSSIVTAAAPDNSRTISVKASALVPGVNIAIAAGTPGGTGTLGTPVAVATLATTDAPIMSGVGSCYTGDGAVGSNLTYTLTTPTGSYSNLVAASTTITVTYTLSDN